MRKQIPLLCQDKCLEYGAILSFAKPLESHQANGTSVPTATPQERILVLFEAPSPCHRAKLISTNLQVMLAFLDNSPMKQVLVRRGVETPGWLSGFWGVALQ